MEMVLSTNSVPIRLTSERWVHIVENHDDLAGRFHEVLEVIAEPDMVVRGKTDELFAIRHIGSKVLVVVYKEHSRYDGFIITAFETSKPKQVTKSREIIWPPK